MKMFILYVYTNDKNVCNISALSAENVHLVQLICGFLVDISHV